MSNSEDTTKECPCVVCGAMVTVTKFATPAKVKCPECKAAKGTPVMRYDGTMEQGYQLPMPSWSDVNDRELRNLTCLSCGAELNIVSIIKSEQWGDVVTAQCPDCFLTIKISEQNRKCKWKLKPVPVNCMGTGEY